MQSYASITKNIEQINTPDRTSQVMRRAFAALRQGRPGPVAVEIPADVAVEDVSEESFYYAPSRRAASQGDPRDVEAAARALCSAKNPVILAGQGVMYAKATEELQELAELLQVPVSTTLLGKSGFDETHPLALGSAALTSSSTVVNFMRRADLVFGIGTSFTRHNMVMTIPPGKTMIHSTNDPRDINKDYNADYPIVGDAKLVLRQMIDACREVVGDSRRNSTTAEEVGRERDSFIEAWKHKLTDDSRPICPYRVIWDFMHTIPPSEGHRDPRFRQSPGPDSALLSFQWPAYLHGVGEVAWTGHRPGTGYGSKAGATGQGLCQLHG